MQAPGRAEHPFGAGVERIGEGAAADDAARLHAIGLEGGNQLSRFLYVAVGRGFPQGAVAEVLVPVVDVEAARLEVILARQAPVQGHRRLPERHPGPVLAGVEVEHGVQCPGSLPRHRGEDVDVAIAADYGVDEGVRMCRGQVREALDLGALHQGVRQDRLPGAGLEHHLQLPEGRALEAADPGLELLAEPPPGTCGS